jgi:hypothetical protein
MIEHIPFGRNNAVTRKYLCMVTGMDDRTVRNLIARERRYTPILNSQDGKGYYQPTLDDAEEVKDFIRQESHRAKSIFYALKGAKDWIKDLDSE